MLYCVSYIVQKYILHIKFHNYIMVLLRNRRNKYHLLMRKVSYGNVDLEIGKFKLTMRRLLSSLAL